MLTWMQSRAVSWSLLCFVSRARRKGVRMMLDSEGSKPWPASAMAAAAPATFGPSTFCLLSDESASGALQHGRAQRKEIASCSATCSEVPIYTCRHMGKGTITRQANVRRKLGFATGDLLCWRRHHRNRHLLAPICRISKSNTKQEVIAPMAGTRYIFDLHPQILRQGETDTQ